VLELLELEEDSLEALLALVTSVELEELDVLALLAAVELEELDVLALLAAVELEELRVLWPVLDVELLDGEAELVEDSDWLLEEDELADEAVELDRLELDALELLDCSSKSNPRKHRRNPISFPAVRAAVLTFNFNCRAMVVRMVVAAVPTGTTSCRPIVPLAAKLPVASTSCWASRPIAMVAAPPEVNRSITSSTPSNTSVLAGTCTSRLWKPMPPPSSAKSYSKARYSYGHQASMSGSYSQVFMWASSRQIVASLPRSGRSRNVGADWSMPCSTVLGNLDIGYLLCVGYAITVSGIWFVPLVGSNNRLPFISNERWNHS